MATRKTKHVPPLRFHALTGMYDRIVAATTRERYFKKSLLSQVSLPREGLALDLGCGTGTMTRWLRNDWPDARVIGLDADARALDIAQTRRPEGGCKIEYQQADAQALPLEDKSVDLVVSSLFFHHLKDDEKEKVLAEVFRVMRPGSQLLVADWGKPDTAATTLGFLLVRCLDGFDRTRANAAGELPSMIELTGFTAVAGFEYVRTIFGRVELMRATKPLVQ